MNYGIFLLFIHRNPDYIKYKKSTPPLIPGITPLYRITPYVLKLIFCCEFPFYNSSKYCSDDGDDDNDDDGGGGGANIDRLLEEGSRSGSTAPNITPRSSSYTQSMPALH